MVVLGIYFYTQAIFGWEMRRNLVLACCQGLFYVLGALSSHRLSDRIGRRPLLAAVNLAMLLVMIVGLAFSRPYVVASLIVVYSLLSAIQWPAMESLVSSGAAALALSRRIAVYNFIWSGTGAMSLAVTGTIVHHWHQGVFVFPMAVHAICFLLLLQRQDDPRSTEKNLDAEPELVPMRTLAMRLSRVALPATYAASYSLGALMPTLPIILQQRPEMRTILASVWMVARWFTFILLGTTHWWHTRPRALLAAAVVLLASFLGITLLQSVASMVLFQISLGAAIGLIYAASLYFGMVLSDGSTEHGGYHEALIGLGSILGPGAGAIAQYLGPGNLKASVSAVAIVLCVSVTGSAVVSLQSRNRS